MATSVYRYGQRLVSGIAPARSLLAILVGSSSYWVYNNLRSDNYPRQPPLPITPELLTTSATFTLPDGRKLGYAQYGLETGKPIIYLHGLPGSRVEARDFDKKAKQIGARIIAVDRPGYGWSSPHPGRTILDHAKDVECLTEFLELEGYGVLGISGGGPYALACAHSLPVNKLKAVTVVCGLGLPDMSKKGMCWPHYGGFTIGFRYFPALTRWWFSRDPATMLHLSDEERLKLLRKNDSYQNSAHPRDVEVLKNDDFMMTFLQTARHSYMQGFDALLQDGKLLSMNFGFKLQDVRKDLPVYLWYGRFDNNCPPVHGEETAERIGPNARLRIEDETHASLYVNWKDKFLEDLVGSF